MTEKTYELSVDDFDMQKSANCGQAFRWTNSDGEWMCISQKKPVLIEQTEHEMKIKCMDNDLEYWVNYLSVFDDYSDIINVLDNLAGFPDITQISSGIKVFKQDPFETLISFIISANNNVSRITKIIDAISKKLGVRVLFDDKEFFAFPDAEAIASSSEDELKSLGTGYRAPYILKSARMVADGYLLDDIKRLDYDDAKKKIQDFPGVGPKVADCILLFSLGFGEAYPMDVWMKRVSMEMFPDCVEAEAVAQAKKLFGSKAGAAQQYLFHYARETGVGK